MLAPPKFVTRSFDLAEHTTLKVGGRAAFAASVTGQAELAEALDWAAAADLPVLVLGSGSNLLVSDDGFSGLVLRLSASRRALHPDGRVVAGAGSSWSDLVDATVVAGLSGIECLTGIPGLVGAAPIQNIGAYGQEVAGAVDEVLVWDRVTGRSETLAAADCGFAYRDSAFKRAPDRYIVLEVRLRLMPGGSPCLCYEEVRNRVAAGAGGGRPTLADARSVVRALRLEKHMLLDDAVLAGPDGRSAGSFFLNPVLTAEAAARLPAEAPRHPAPGCGVKVPAAWLIERAGVGRGFALGRAAISTRHTLALVNRGGARAADLLALAAHVQRAVRRRFGVTLFPEPVFAGFDRPAAEVLEAMENTLSD